MWRRVVSQAPKSMGGVGTEDSYLENVGRLQQLLRSGRSFSGRERNRAFMNLGNGTFANISSVAGFDFPDDARGLMMVDVDDDGDLDAWLINRTAPQLRLMRNNSPTAHASVSLDLEGTRSNRDAIGARVMLKLDTGAMLMRTLRAGEGFLSQNSKRLHFGLGDARVVEASVVWPNGKREAIGGIGKAGAYRIVEGTGQATPRTRRPMATPKRDVPIKPPTVETSRTVLADPLPLYNLAWQRHEGGQQPFAFGDHRGTLINLWAGWCAPCIKELSDFTRSDAALTQAGIRVLPLAVDGLGDDRSDVAKAMQLIKRLRFPHQHGRATNDLLTRLDILLQQVYGINKPLPVPTSLLVDRWGRLRVIYKGPVEPETLLADSRALLNETMDDALAYPLPGRRYTVPRKRAYHQIARDLLQQGYRKEAAHYLSFVDPDDDVAKQKAAEVLVNIAVSYAREKAFGKALEKLTTAVTEVPDSEKVHFNLGLILKNMGKVEEAIPSMTRATELDPSYARAHHNLANLHMGRRNLNDALPAYKRAADLEPRNPEYQNALAMALLRAGLSEEAEQRLRQAVAHTPENAGLHFTLGRIYVSQKRVDQALTHFDLAHTYQPEAAPILQELIWITAASNRDNLRNGLRALALAERYQRLNPGPKALQLLAAAKAETGAFGEAVALLDQATQSMDPSQPLARQITQMKAILATGKPFRHPRY